MANEFGERRFFAEFIRWLKRKNMLIYFAGPLFSQAEKEFNLRLTFKLESLGFNVFLPQRDGIEKNKTPYNRITKEKRRKKLIVGLQTDVRAAFLGSKLNPMLRGYFDFQAKNERDLIRFFKRSS